IRTCGSTFSNACSRSFIAYLAKSAAVAYGEVDCSSPKTFGAPATARLKQTTRSLFMQTVVSSIRFRALKQGEFFNVAPVKQRILPTGTARNTQKRFSGSRQMRHGNRMLSIKRVLPKNTANSKTVSG